MTKSIKKIPESYFKPIENGGDIVRVDYTTEYGENKEIIDKYAYVYLPFGYDESKKYDILYCLHGGGGEIEIFFGDGEAVGDIKITLDNMIANNDIEPIIAVSPTYYSKTREHDLDSAVEEIERFCEKELIEDLIPVIETKFSTYADSVDREGLKASREHRAYTGFSMGSLSTWTNYVMNVDCFKYFMPMSGDYWINGESIADEAAKVLADAATNSGYSKDDIYIHAITGDEDIAYLRMKNMIEELEKKSSFFEFMSDEKEGNFGFSVEPLAIHDYKYMPLYFYNVIPEFFK